MTARPAGASIPSIGEFSSGADSKWGHAGLDIRSKKFRPTASPQRSQVNTRSTVSGALSSTRNRARAAPVGRRFPCSQMRIVSCGTSVRRAISVGESPGRRLRRGTQSKASRMQMTGRAWNTMVVGTEWAVLRNPGLTPGSADQRWLFAEVCPLGRGIAKLDGRKVHVNPS